MRARHIPGADARGWSIGPALCGRMVKWNDVEYARRAYRSPLNRMGACRRCVGAFVAETAPTAETTYAYDDRFGHQVVSGPRDVAFAHRDRAGTWWIVDGGILTSAELYFELRRAMRRTKGGR